MTAIAGWIETNGDVWLGADSASSGGQAIEIWRTSKVFVRGGIGIAYTWSWRFGQLLHHRLEVPRIPRASDVERWACVEFIDAVRKCLKDGGWLEKEKEREAGGACLLAVRGRLFVMQSDFSMGEVRGRYTAHGCGRDLVYGALHATAHLKWKPKARLLAGLKAAAHFSTGVAGPFRVMKVPK